tara:strand:- start:1181 stop:1840 length:660 start_codon:yes stop_codon:yes gene_type:complete
MSKHTVSNAPYKLIDIDSWARKEHYCFYKDYNKPYFSLTANVDVTEIINYSKFNNTSFFLLSLFCSMNAINNVDAFRLRMQKDEVRLYDYCHPSSTIFHENKTFTYVLFDYKTTLEAFLKSASILIKKAKENPQLNSIDSLANVTYYSSIPWVQFTSFTNAFNKGQSEDIPRIVFGKYFQEGSRYKMPVAVEVHHALIDGYDVGQYYHQLQSEINKFSI